MLRPRLALGAQVYEHVKQLLLDGELESGAAIQVDAIASDLGVSRQPVMDAVRRLVQEGFVTIVPQVGSFPRSYKVGEILDFFKLFAESESIVAMLACQRADAAGLARLKTVSTQIGKLRGSGLSSDELARQYRTLNRRFHTEMRDMTGSIAVAEIVESMGDRSDFLVALSRAPIFPKRLKEAHAEHEEMIAAIQARDSERAMSVMRRHVLTIADRIAILGEGAGANEPKTESRHAALGKGRLANRSVKAASSTPSQRK